MADITDIKSILYTEKTLGLQEGGVVVIQTSPRVNKNNLKDVLKEYFGITPLKVNSLKMHAKVKKIRGRVGVRDTLKKFYVTLPEGVSLDKQEA